MTTYLWPSTKIFMPSTQTLRQTHNNLVFESPQSGAIQTASSPGARWGWIMDLSPHTMADRASLEAFMSRLSGREHRVQLWDMKRPVPRGTCNLAGVTLNAAAAQFATTIQLAGCGANATLLAGDWLGFSTGQLCMVVTDATASGGGVMTVEVRQMLRAALASSSAVTLNKPLGLFVNVSNMVDFPRQGGWAMPEVSFEFTEVFS